MDFEHVDEEYATRMVGYEVDCNDGKGEAMACHQVGEFYSVVKDDAVKAAKMFEMNCEKNGFGPSCFNLAKQYLAGRGVTKNNQTALSLFTTSCGKNHLQGCCHQGLLMMSEAHNLRLKWEDNPTPELKKTIIENRTKAVGVLESACGSDEYESCFFAGSYYLEADNPRRDPLKARDLLKIACDNNHHRACFNLAVMYNKGDTNLPANRKEFEKYKTITEQLVEQTGAVTTHVQ